jgi:hypothetical protein
MIFKLEIKGLNELQRRLNRLQSELTVMAPRAIHLAAGLP